MFRKAFSSEGRIGRSKYALVYLAYLVISNILGVVFETNFRTNLKDNLSIAALYWVLYMASFVFCTWIMLAQGAKRCHDRGNSGWYQVNPSYQLWMLFAAGDNGENAYGPDPKMVSTAAAN